jgi:hypothetical protein
LVDSLKEIKKVSDNIVKSALIVNGDALNKILAEEKLKDEFLNVA